MTDMLEEETERYWPVLDFRWFEEKVVFKPFHQYKKPRLQQRYISNTGKEMWKDIPTVKGD